MKFVRFEFDNELKLGFLSKKNDSIHEINAVLKDLKIPEITNMKDFIEYYCRNKVDLDKIFKETILEDGPFFLDKIKLKTPVIPSKIICLGLNYVDHAKETGKRLPKVPMLFSKAISSLLDPFDYIELPSKFVDYEVELAIIIGKECKKASIEDAAEYIFGFTILNDVSERKVQMSDKQFFRGKSYDTFAPMGPHIVTNLDTSNLNLELQLNGNVMQKSNTNNLIFNVQQIVSFISEGITLKPGDVIGTGTPPGVGVAQNPPVFLKSGDKLELFIENIGKLINFVK